MTANPFASFNLEIPNRYREAVTNYSRTGGNKNTAEYAPFRRQVDFWYLALLIGVAKKLSPEPERDTYNATPGTIFGSDPYRIKHMQLLYLGVTKDLEKLSDSRKVFDYCLGIANAGMPHLIQILSDPDERPIWSIYDELESMVSR